MELVFDRILTVDLIGTTLVFYMAAGGLMGRPGWIEERVYVQGN
jgi:hypothetical protein